MICLCSRVFGKSDIIIIEFCCTLSEAIKTDFKKEDETQTSVLHFAHCLRVKKTEILNQNEMLMFKNMMKILNQNKKNYFFRKHGCSEKIQRFYQTEKCLYRNT